MLSPYKAPGKSNSFALVANVVFGIAAVISVTEMVTGNAILPYSTWILVAAWLAKSALTGLGASGAFEIVDVDTGAVLFSKLATGRLPKLEDVIDKL